MSSEAPRPDPVDVTLASYERATDRYLEANSASPPPAMCAYLDQFADLIGAGRVLELGSGPGRDADYVQARGSTVVRTDATPRFVERLRALGHDARLLDVRHDALGGPYDGVMANAVLLHLDRTRCETALRRARTAVTSAGVLAVTVKEGAGAGWSSAKLGLPRHFTYWRELPLREMLARTGWSVLSLEHVAGRAESWLFVLACAADAAHG